MSSKNVSTDGQEATVNGGGWLNSVHDTSKRLGVSSFTVRRLIKTKQLRAVRVGKRVLIPTAELARVIAEGCGKHAEIAQVVVVG